MNGRTKVCQLSKCDGSPSNVAMEIETGTVLHRKDGPKNCCPVLLKFLYQGSGEPPSFPHEQHELDYRFLGPEPKVTRIIP
jgi:hypothetical protein